MMLLSYADSEVAMTPVISSHVKDKNRIFTGCAIFVTGKIWYFIGVYIARNDNMIL